MVCIHAGENTYDDDDDDLAAIFPTLFFQCPPRERQGEGHHLLASTVKTNDGNVLFHTHCWYPTIKTLTSTKHALSSSPLFPPRSTNSKLSSVRLSPTTQYLPLFLFPPLFFLLYLQEEQLLRVLNDALECLCGYVEM